MERSKRVINKPPRYLTTSSDEAPKRKRVATLSGTAAEVEEDIEELRATLEEDTDEMNHLNHTNYNKDTLPTQTQYLPPQTHTTRTNTPSYTILDTHSQKSYNTCANTHPNTSTSDVAYTSHAYPSAHGYTPHSQSETLNYPVTFTEFQDNTEQFGPSAQNMHRRHQAEIRQGMIHCDRRVENQMQSKESLHERLDRVEAELKKMNTLLQNISKCVQDRSRATRKPTFFPISSLEEMEKFEDIDEGTYSDVVNYFGHIGGFNLKEATSLCLKESLTDSLTPSFTWWGQEGGPRALYNTRLTMAIYEAVCSNRHFNRPTRAEFQARMKETLRTAKERMRHKQRGPRAQAANARNRRQDLWSDERLETEEIEHAKV